jgi:hypothetical protein
LLIELRNRALAGDAAAAETLIRLGADNERQATAGADSQI